MRLTLFFAALFFIAVFSGCVKDPGHQPSHATIASNQGGPGDPDPHYTPPLFERLSTKSLSVPRRDHAAAATGNKVIFAGGGSETGTSHITADIFDATTLERTTANLSQARSSLAGAGAGNRIVFAGGRSASGISAIVDIYNTSTNTWSTARLSEARYDIAAAAAGNKIIFAGGTRSNGAPSTKADVYDVVTNTWTAVQLIAPRKHLAGAAAGNKIVFAGIAENNQAILADVYDASTNTWSFGHYEEFTFTSLMAAGGAHNKVLFAGAKVYSYNPGAYQWSETNLSVSRDYFAAGSVGEYILFAGGHDGYAYTKAIDIYNAKTDKWLKLQLLEGKALLKAASAKNRIFFGGGRTKTGVESAVEIFQLNKKPSLCSGCF